MSRMVARQTELAAYSSMESKKVQKPLLRINLEEELSPDGRLEQEARERSALMKKDKMELE